MKSAPKITKAEAISPFGSGYALAKALGIAPASVYQWPDGMPIPELQAMRLAFLIRPDIFGPAQTKRRSGHGKAA
ncbi:Cro/CI family transcriptional regulator [Frateuria aurantia]|uniref:Cro/CI family transcriptional regulator n=1 Tax=Frateuria aurantia TaxID=81475 RepID=UPI000A0029CF